MFFGTGGAAIAPQDPACFVQVGFQRVGPVPKRAGVVGAQVFSIHYFQSGARHLYKHRAHMEQLASGDYVLADEVTHACTKLAVCNATSGDAVVHDPPARPAPEAA